MSYLTRVHFLPKQWVMQVIPFLISDTAYHYNSMKKAPPCTRSAPNKGGGFFQKSPYPKKNRAFGAILPPCLLFFGRLSMFFILKTVVLARVLQIFRACGALFLSTRFLQAFCNVRVCCPARKSNVIKFQSNSALTIAADSADIVSFCACVESAVASRKANVTKPQRAIHTVKSVLCMSCSDLRSPRKSSIFLDSW